MATYFDEKGYRAKSTGFQKRVINWTKIANMFDGLEYVIRQLEKMAILSTSMADLIILTMKLRSEELKAEKELASPTDEMYDFTRKVYGGLIYHGVDDATIQQIFMRGRPDPLNTPPEQVQILLQAIKSAFGDVLMDHPIALEKGPDLERLLAARMEMVEAERAAENATLKARAELIECGHQMDNAITILKYLSRADNVNVDGIYRALFPLPKESKPASTETTEPVTTPDEVLVDEEDIIVGGSA